jgi:hypothetical protein
MPILLKGNPKRLLGQDVSQEPSTDFIAWELTAHHRCGKSVIASDYILRNLDKPIVVFSWDVEGISLNDLSNTLERRP